MTGAMKTEAEILVLYQRVGAVWLWDDSRGADSPHAELTSGLCSDGYVNSAVLLRDPKLLAEVCGQLLLRLKERAVSPDWVVGSAYKAITFSYELARQLGACHGFVKKDEQNPKRMIWEGEIPQGAEVLQAEEVITTFGTTMEVRRAIFAGNGRWPVRFLPYVLTAIHRPPSLLANLGAVETIALVTRVIRTWEPSACPLCKAGSRRLRPAHHWREFSGQR